MPELDPAHFDLSQTIAAKDMEELAEIRAGARDAAIEGVMIERRQSRPMSRGAEPACGTSGNGNRC